MLNQNKSEQYVTEGSFALQSGGDITINHGLQFHQVRQIAIDMALQVFTDNFHKLSGVAAATARSRAEEITKDFFEELLDKNQNGILRAGDPDFQYSLFNVQQYYARAGDMALGKLLIDLLIDISKENQRTLLQIVLAESLVVAPKLTNQELSMLALLFVFKYHVASLEGVDALLAFFDMAVAPFVSDAEFSDTSFAHMQFCGCTFRAVHDDYMHEIMKNKYGGLFSEGCTREYLTEIGISSSLMTRFFMPLPADPSRLFLAFQNHEALRRVLDDPASPPIPERNRLIGIFDGAMSSADSVKKICTARRPYLAKLFGIWDASQLRKQHLTSVGICLGHASVKRFVNNLDPLSFWIK